jgi:titin
VRLAWRDNSADEATFRVEMSRAGGAFSEIRTLPANTVSLLVTGLAPGTRYAFRVRARNAAGFSAYSNRVDVSTPR